MLTYQLLKGSFPIELVVYCLCCEESWRGPSVETRILFLSFEAVNEHHIFGYFSPIEIIDIECVLDDESFLHFFSWMPL